MSSNSSEEAPPPSFKVPGGVKYGVSTSGTVFSGPRAASVVLRKSERAPTATATARPSVALPAPAPAPIRATSATVRPSVAPPAPAPARATSTPKPATAPREVEPPAPKPDTIPEEEAAEVETADEVARLEGEIAKLKERRRALKYITPVPETTHEISAETFHGKDGAKIRSAIGPTTTPELSGSVAYRPVTAGRRQFQQFIIQKYAEYSPVLNEVFRAPPEERAAVLAKYKARSANPDRDACKKRDPNKVESFYYQKFVQEYLKQGTPYRGSLVYHGLGTGKTCTSVAAAEALYHGGRKVIYVLTPATLSNNYRRELGKCGYYPLRQNNIWRFVRYDPDKVFLKTWLTEKMGLPEDVIIKQGGAWVPEVPGPGRESNWASLTAEEKTSIRNQQRAHMEARFKFIHYNGVMPGVLAKMAYDADQTGHPLFDNAVVIIDEIHNLVRTINGTTIGSLPIAEFMRREEPTSATWGMERTKKLGGRFRYPRGYTLYRLLQNAVGAKIIALSATPMINYAQEFAILMNIVGGEQRTVEINLSSADRRPDTVKRLKDWAIRHPAIDYWYYGEAIGSVTPTLTVTPVPYGFKKVVDPEKDYSTRGFVSLKKMELTGTETSRERNMDAWAASLVAELQEAGILAAPGGGAAAGGGAEARPYKVVTYPLIIDDPNRFVNLFIDRATLNIQNGDILRARAMGLISYYRGGSEELMPRKTSEIVEVPFSEYAFKEYSAARLFEIEQDSSKRKAKKGDGAAATEGKGGGLTAGERDLYSQATKSLDTGFLALSRAACNWVWPEDVDRPVMDKKARAKLMGLEQDRVIAVDREDAEEAPEAPETSVGPAAAGGGAAADAGEEAAAEATTAALPDAPEPAPVKDTASAAVVDTLMAPLERPGTGYLSDGLATFSPKYAAIMERIAASPGPVLVYSQFKTLEGLGIFAAALRASAAQYVPLDIVKNAATGEWEIPERVMTAILGSAAGGRRPAYILYTGDQALDKRRLLLQLYNAEVGGLPAKLAEQCTALLAGAPDNRDGRVCRVFMITQSGAEGISMMNTRQVHLMEPYWNNVRMEQVIGRAIRLCSHMNLPWDDRHVNVYTYISVFSEAQKAMGGEVSKLMTADKGQTTDQSIFGIAQVKERLAHNLEEIAQSAATDCDLHYYEHSSTGAPVQCFTFQKTLVGDAAAYSYHPDIRRDLMAAGVSIDKL